MREIKFRAWDKKRKEILRITMMDFAEWWVSCRPPGTQVDPLEYGERNSFKNEETDRHILMQYTGLKDKNGKEIYEGDILDATWGYRGEVEMDTFLMATLECTISDDVEVIGNIYENPELLEEK